MSVHRVSAQVSAGRAGWCVLWPAVRQADLWCQTGSVTSRYARWPSIPAVTETVLHTGLSRSGNRWLWQTWIHHILMLYKDRTLFSFASLFQCNATCGRGVRQRQVVCAGLEGGVFKEFPDSSCNQTNKPQMSSSCFRRPCSKWFTTSWSQVATPVISHPAHNHSHLTFFKLYSTNYNLQVWPLVHSVQQDLWAWRPGSRGQVLSGGGAGNEGSQLRLCPQAGSQAELWNPELPNRSTRYKNAKSRWCRS